MLHAGALRGSDARRRFEREARALSGLLHAHVVGALEIGEHGAGSAARPYLVMELLSGPSLESLIARADDALYRAKLGGRNRVEN